MATTHTTTASEIDLAAPSRSAGLRVAGWAGIAGPVLFTVVFLAQDLLRAGFDPVAAPVSALAAGPLGWVQQLNFVAFGVLTVLFAIGLHAAVRPTPGGAAGPALLFVTGIGLLLAAAFPLREDQAGVVYDPGGHVVGGMLFFPGTALALVLLSRRLARDPRWRDLARPTLTAGALSVAVVVVVLALVLPEGGPLHHLAGLVQRALLLLLFFPCRIALSARLLRVVA